MNDKAIEIVEAMPKRERAVAVSGDANTALLQVIANAARDPNVDVAKMQALYEMHKDAKAQAAREAFAAAMAEFKANPPKIVKDKHVAIPHKSGGGSTEYDHATLGHVCDAIIAGLAAVSISHRWELEQPDGGAIRVTCVLTHAQGHEVKTTLQAGRDDSGSKNNIQAMGSTQTYLSRYTLLAATGLAAGLPDDDGAEAYERITEDQAADIKALIEEVGANKVAFLRYLKVDRIDQIAADAYSDVIRLLEAKRKK